MDGITKAVLLTDRMERRASFTLMADSEPEAALLAADLASNFEGFEVRRVEGELGTVMYFADDDVLPTVRFTVVVR